MHPIGILGTFSVPLAPAFHMVINNLFCCSFFMLKLLELAKDKLLLHKIKHHHVFSGILLVVSIGVALGVFFGGILLTAVVLYMKR